MRKSTADITQAVTSALAQPDVASDKPLIVALSGGVDSQVLAHAVISATRGTGRAVCAVHVDHRLRDASAADADSVAQLCREWEIPCEVVTVDVPRWESALGQGTEAAARAARYAALAQAAHAAGTDVVATGHTLDDQAETVLLRLISGTGLEGLGGMSQVTKRQVLLDPEGADTLPVTVLRPLIDCSRRMIEQYAREEGVEPIEDESNEALAFRRNAIRTMVVPELEQIEPAMRESISRTAELLREDAGFISTTVDELYAELVAERAGVWMVERQQFRDAHPAQQRRILFRIVEPLASPGARIGQERIEALRYATVNGQPGKKIELADDLIGYVDYDRLAIGRTATLEGDLRKLSWVPLVAPGTETPLGGDIDIPLDNGWRIRGEAPEGSGLVLRSRRDGDRVRGVRGRVVKLQDWLVDRKVPRYVRDWLPVVASGEQIYWIIGLDVMEFSDSRTGMHLYLELDAGAEPSGR